MGEMIVGSTPVLPYGGTSSRVNPARFYARKAPSRASLSARGGFCTVAGLRSFSSEYAKITSLRAGRDANIGAVC